MKQNSCKENRFHIMDCSNKLCGAKHYIKDFDNETKCGYCKKILTFKIKLELENEE